MLAIIPARGGSTRLLRKNIRHIWGKPMIYWVIKAAERSKHITDRPNKTRPIKSHLFKDTISPK